MRGATLKTTTLKRVWRKLLMHEIEQEISEQERTVEADIEECHYIA